MTTAPTSVDTAQNTVTITYGNKISKSGSVTQWNYLAGAAGKAVLQIWRHGTSGKGYELICSTDADSTGAGPQMVVVQPPCDVEEGDFPGLWQADHGVVVVRYQKNVDADYKDAVQLAGQVEGVKIEPKVGMSFTVPDISNAASKNRNYAVQLTICGSDWGFSFLYAFAAASLLYIGGGLVRGRLNGRNAGKMLEWHPHYVVWKEAAQLVTEGAAYSRARLLRQQSAGAYTAAQTNTAAHPQASRRDMDTKGKKSSKHKRHTREGRSR